jgi:endonuclease/exonuclease/phosphatase (EEP) superfamily protein YafD
MTEIAKLIEATAGRKLVMGDFNTTPFSRMMAALQDRASLERLTFLPSWPAQWGLPQIAIDHILVSPGLRLLAPARIGEAAGSDHYPVTALIAVPLAP